MSYPIQHPTLQEVWAGVDFTFNLPTVLNRRLTLEEQYGQLPRF